MREKKRFKSKRILSFLMSVALVLSTLTFQGSEVSASGNITICGVNIGIAAGTHMQFSLSNGTESESGYYYNGYYLAASQCFGFARWCQYKLFGCNSGTKSSAFYKLTVNGVSDIAAGSLTTANLKAMITAAKPGAHLRTHESSSFDPHSMVITSITNDGFSIAQCNGSNNNEYSTWKKNYVGTYTYTWSSYVASTYGKRGIAYIQLPYNYPYSTNTTNPANSYTVDSNYSSFTPFHAYALDTGNISVYSSPEGSVLPNRYITGSTDECIIEEVYTNGWCKVTYPSSVSSTGYYEAFVKLSTFISGSSPSKWTADAGYTAYKRSSGSDSIGSVSKGDSCLKVSSGNGRTQVIYPVTGKGYYKMGWIGAASTSTSSSSGGTSNATVSNSYKTPCKSYAISTGKVSVYDAVNGSVEQNRYIAGSTDVCTIEEIYTNGWCKVTYPTSTSTRTAFTPLSEFITNASPTAWTATANYTAYRRSSGSETIGSITNGDRCIKVSESNGRMQVMYPVTGTGEYKMGWIDKTGGNDPTYAIDNCSGGLYSLSVAGWAFDADDTGAQLGVDVYIGSTLLGSVTANASRADVNSVYACGANHGFSKTFTVPSNLTGSQTVTIKIANVGSGSTKTITKSVTITADTTAPAISNVKVTDVTENGYTVSCTVTDANGIDRVQFPTWTSANGQDDLFKDWGTSTAAQGTASGSTYTYHVYISAHNYETGKYNTHIYAYDKYGNSNIATVSVNVPAPVSSIDLDYEEILFKGINESVTLQATLKPDDAVDKTVTWVSSDSTVATVNEGKVVATGYGTAVIKATTANGLSAECAVTVRKPAVAIVSEPDDIVVDSGATVNLSVGATGDGLTYQWQFKKVGGSWTSWVNYKSATMTTKASAAWDGMKIRCIVTDEDGNTATTREVACSLNTITGIDLVITSQPQDIITEAGKSVTLSVGAAGDGLTYQWQYKKVGGNWSSWANYKSASMTTKATAAWDGMKIRCIVTDVNGNTVTTREVQSSFQSNTSKGITITSQPQDVTTAAGTSVTLSVEATGDGLTYQWQYKKVGGNWSSWANYKSASMTTKATAAWDGMKIRCIITDVNGNTVTTREVQSSFKSNTGTGITITSQPQDIITAAGTSVTLSVGATGDGLIYQWQYKKVGGNWTSWTNYKSASMTTKATAAWDGMKIRCIITDANGSTATTREVQSSFKSSTSTGITITSQPQDVTTSANEKVTLSVGATGNGLTYQWQYKKVGGNWSSWANYKSATMSTKASASWNGMKIRCIVTDANGNSVTTKEITATLK